MSKPSSAFQLLFLRLRSYTSFWSVALFVLLLDQISKWFVFHKLSLSSDPSFTPSITVIPDFLYILHVHNTGAAWSLFSGYPQLLGIFGALVLGALYLLRRHLEIKKPIMQWVFGLLVGGIVGNMVDRIKHGFVIDFLDVHLPHYRWPAFNFADCAISMSIILYILMSFGLLKRKSNTH